MNAIMKRWVQSCRHELLDRTLIWNERHLRRALGQYERFYHAHRARQAMMQAAARTRYSAGPTRTVMVGGPETAFRAAEPRLRRLGSRITHVGGNGQGLLLKLAINISLAAQMLAFSEGILLAERSGIDPELAAHAMTTSAIGSPMLQARAPARPRPTRPGMVRRAAHAQRHPPRAAGTRVTASSPR
jgi:hypothetical protein